MVKLPRQAHSLSVAVAILALPAMAAAQSRSESIDIDITIPPFAAGLAAASEGAVGFSTFDQPGGGLLVKSPDTISTGSNGDVSVFSQSTTIVTARVGSGPDATPTSLASITNSQTTPFKGMQRTNFTVTPNAGGSNGAGQGPPVVSVVVSAL
jgi:hypothetical protein